MSLNYPQVRDAQAKRLRDTEGQALRTERKLLEVKPTKVAA